MDSCGLPEKGIALNELLDGGREYSKPLCFHLSERLLNVVNSTTKRRLGKLDPYTMREYLMSKQVPPVSLLTALIFIEKFTNTESAPQMLEEMTAVELFTVSLMLASKYLYDVDCDHGAYNSEWADAFGIDLYDLNRWEIRFLSALNWCCYVDSGDLEAVYRSTRPAPPDARRSSKPCARAIRSRRSGRVETGRRKSVASKVLAVLAATYVTYMNGSLYQDRSVSNTADSSVIVNSTYPSPPSPAFREDTATSTAPALVISTTATGARNLTWISDGTRFAWFKSSSGDDNSRPHMDYTRAPMVAALRDMAWRQHSSALVTPPLGAGADRFSTVACGG